MRGQWIAAVLMVAGLTGPTARVDAQIVDVDHHIAKLAAEAESAEQHARVAAQARERAQQLDTEAARHERAAQRLQRQWFPNEYKTAAMLQPGYRERQRAANARHGARAARALADRHRQIAADLRNAP